MVDFVELAEQERQGREGPEFKLFAFEVRQLRKEPAALRALAEFLEVELTKADAGGWPIDDMLARKAELLGEAFRLEREWCHD